MKCALVSMIVNGRVTGRMGLAVAKLKGREDAEPLPALPALGARPLPTAGLSNL